MEEKKKKRKEEKKKKRNKNIRNDRKLSNKYMRRIPNSANEYNEISLN